MSDVLCYLLLCSIPPLLPDSRCRARRSIALYHGGFGGFQCSARNADQPLQLYYHYLQDPSFHQNAYAILTAVVLFRSMYVMETSLRPSLRAKYVDATREDLYSEVHSKEQRANVARRDEQILRTMWLMIGMGLSIFLGGFAIWTLDNVYCSNLRRWRREIGLPWGILLEGHGWWYVHPCIPASIPANLSARHLMTGVGAYFYITWGVWLRHCLNDKQEEYVLDWPSVFFSLPEIVRAPGALKSSSNGSSKKSA
jgi:dihydroceramidase